MICRDCSYNSNVAKSKGYKTNRIDEHCTHCSCPLMTKTRSMHANCPIGKWKAVLTSEEQAKLNSLKNDNKEHTSESVIQSTHILTKRNNED